MNNVSLIGNLTREPELREAKGSAVCQLRVAVDNPGRGGEKGEVSTFGDQAQWVSANLIDPEQQGVAGVVLKRLRHRCGTCLHEALSSPAPASRPV